MTAMSQDLTPADASTDAAWADLRALTRARIALGRSGAGQRTADVLAFGIDHALARDAVRLPLDLAQLRSELEQTGFSTQQVHSAAPDRASYLMRPDLGRRLDAASAAALQPVPGGIELLPVIGDGLSALGVQRYSVAVLRALRERAGDLQLGPVVIASQARVALGDEIGERLSARMVVMLIGERPGLSSPDSLGLYLTRHPRVGRVDAERNCISNVRVHGLAPEEAARKLLWLAREARRLGATGVGLKDLSDALPLAP
jgi:ethanolamine ammonia-lyase small subunit